MSQIGSQIREFRVPPVIRFGSGASLTAGTEARALGGRCVLLVSGPSTGAGKACQAVAVALRDAGLTVVAYAGVDREPELSHVAAGLALQQQHSCDLIVGFGGGSPLDAAKAIAFMATNNGRVEDYMGLDKVTRPGLPFIAIPTTAGTGSEATRFTIITDAARSVKMLIGSPLLVPHAALLDPDLTLGMPKPLTAATGLDALTHAIEAYVSRKAQPMSDVMALSAIRLLGANLLQAWREPDDHQARSATLLGSLQAGMAFSNASVALVHGMSRPVGALFHVPHGVSNAVLLGEVMEFSLPGNVERYAEIALALGVDPQASAQATAAAGVARVKALIRNMDVPARGQLGITKDDLDRHAGKMADDALASGSPGNNPRLATRQEIIDLYYKTL